MTDRSGIPAPYGDRLARLRDRVAGRGIDGVYVAAGPTMRYYTGCTSYESGWPIWLSGLVIPWDRLPILVLSEMHEVLLGDTDCWVGDVRTYRDGEDPSSALTGALRGAGITSGRLGVEDSLWFGDATFLRAHVPDVELVGVGADVQHLRSIKDDHEVAILREAARINDIGYRAAHDACAAGVPLRAVGEAAIGAMVEAGAESNAISGDFRTMRPDPLAPGAVIDVDLAWTAYRGYRTDSARNFFVAPVDPIYRRIYEAVQIAHRETLAMLRPGVRAGDVNARAETVIRDAGFRQPWKIGHGIGLSAGHEWPLLQDGNDTRLEPNMVFTIDPGAFVTQDGRAVPIHIEDIVLLTDDGHDVLTRYPTGMLVVE